jgi:hypothetical protein
MPPLPPTFHSVRGREGGRAGERRVDLRLSNRLCEPLSRNCEKLFGKLRIARVNRQAKARCGVLTASLVGLHVAPRSSGETMWSGLGSRRGIEFACQAQRKGGTASGNEAEHPQGCRFPQ